MSELPGTLRIGFSRIGVELKQLFRDLEAAVFTLALPMILMIVFGSVFGGQEPAAVPAGVGVDTSGQVFNAPDGSMQINTDAPVQTYEQPPQQQQGGDILGDLLGQILGR